MSAADTIKRMARSTIVLTNVTADAGYNADGIRTTPTVTTKSVSAVVQPLPPGALQKLPEGDKATFGITIWTTEPLAQGDKVGYGGITYEIVRKQDWGDFLSGGRYVALDIR